MYISSAVASCTIVAGNAMVSANTTGYVGFKLGVFGCATLTNITADGVTVTTCPYTWVSVIMGVGEGVCWV